MENKLENIEQTRKWLEEGKKVRRKGWGINTYLWFDKKNLCIRRENNVIIDGLENYPKYGWELAENVKQEKKAVYDGRIRCYNCKGINSCVIPFGITKTNFLTSNPDLRCRYCGCILKEFYVETIVEEKIEPWGHK